MWCPKCKNEYVPGITRCADCDVDLVESLEEPAVESVPSTPVEPENNEPALKEDTLITHAYISKKSKTEDMKSTAYAFTSVSIVGLILLVLFATGVLPLHTASYMKIMICIVMGAMFLIFLVIGIRSFRQIKSYADAADSEEHLLTEITTWFLNSYNKDTIDANIDTSAQEELLYFARYEVMRQSILSNYPDVEESLLDHIIETLYAQLF